jgi:hypothetical protein
VGDKTFWRPGLMDEEVTVLHSDRTARAAL